MRIQQLSPFVANQIAAGEVIERPASVVKELLENSLDAEADSIHIEISHGGLNQIKISDNGLGIVADDLPLAISAHATSKIRQLTDLYAVQSMGFRGEALASIAAVSRLSISSKSHEAPHAMMLRSDGTDHKLVPCARSQGTTVDVTDLFYNVSVRKKFLKGAQSEYQAIEMVVKRFALSAPHIALTLSHNGLQRLELPRATSEKARGLRIKKLLGKQFTEQAVCLDIQKGPLCLLGWASGRDYARSQNDKQWIYINQRCVKDKLLNHAIKRAYEELLPSGRYPACVLYLTLPLQEVDVNVHPTKHEVRFQQPRLVHDFVVSSIAEALDAFSIKKPPEHIDHHRLYEKPPLWKIHDFEPSLNHYWLVLNSQFVLVFLQEVPYLVDVALVQQERLITLLGQEPRPLDSRPLLVPVTYPIHSKDDHRMDEYQPILAELGIQLDWVGVETVVVRSLPNLLPQLDIKKLLAHLRGVLLTPDALLTLAVSCQSLDAHHIPEEDRPHIIAYLEQALSTSGSRRLGCVRLDAETCRDLLEKTK